MKYVFEEKQVKFKYCPYCCNETFEIYVGDFAGYITCPKCEVYLDFLEMLSLYPNG